MKKILLLITLTIVTLTANAQLRISTDGNVGVGTYMPQHKFDLNIGTANTFRIKTWISLYTDNSGHYGSVCMYPEDNFFFQLGKSGQQVGELWVCEIHGLWTLEYSDIRLKENIRRIDNPLQRIMQVNGIKYNMKSDNYDGFPDAKREEYTRDDYGFVAQELQEIFPEVVVSDTDGILSVKYTRLIPVLVEAIKEQQAIIENLQEEISRNIDIQIHERQNGETIIGTDQRNNELRVFQNAPNPFNEATTIRCFVPEREQNVKLCVYDMHGVQQKCISVTGRNIVDVQIQAGELPAGIYAYLLKSDLNVSESKQMIVTN